MLVIAETMTAKSTMKLLQSPVGLGVGTVGPIAGADRRRQRPWMVHQADHLVG